MRHQRSTSASAGEPAGELFSVSVRTSIGNAAVLHRGDERSLTNGLVEHRGHEDESGVVVDPGEELQFANYWAPTVWT